MPHTTTSMLHTRAQQGFLGSLTLVMKAFAENTIGGFKESGNFANLTHDDVQMQGLDQRKYALNIEYQVYRGSHTVSYVYQIYEDTLGAHGNTYYRTFTFDTNTGAAIELGDLFTGTAPYLERLSTQARADLPGIIRAASGSDADMAEIKAGTQPEEDSFQNFAIDGSTLRLIFPPYQVGPYSIGTVIDPIPLATFKDILQAVYMI
jgi:Protein of unknown function (DUF3298)